MRRYEPVNAPRNKAAAETTRSKAARRRLSVVPCGAYHPLKENYVDYLLRFR